MPKRGTDHTWQLIKYIGDIGIYAKCKCGHHYCCSTSPRTEDGSWSIDHVPTIFYPYCPMCGARKKWRTNDIKKIDKYWFED